MILKLLLDMPPVFTSIIEVRTRHETPGGMMTGSFDLVWGRIVRAEGEPFHQKTGRPFTYSVVHGSVVPSTTNRILPRSHFLEAYRRAPVKGPGQLQDLQGPSYLFAILADPRVSPGFSGWRPPAW